MHAVKLRLERVHWLLEPQDGSRITHEDNREGDVFVYQKCGKELHSDYNAVAGLRPVGSKREAFATAQNTVHKFIQNQRKSGSGGPTYHLALKSGTVNGNGEYSPSTV